MLNEEEAVTLIEEHKRVCEKARQCVAEAQALMMRLDRLDMEWAKPASGNFDSNLSPTLASSPANELTSST